MCVPRSIYSLLLPGRAFNRVAIPGHRSLLQAWLMVTSRSRFPSRGHPRSWQSPVLLVVATSRWRFRFPVHPRSWPAPSSRLSATRCFRRSLLPGRAVAASASQRVNCVPGHCCFFLHRLNGRTPCVANWSRRLPQSATRWRTLCNLLNEFARIPGHHFPSFLPQIAVQLHLKELLCSGITGTFGPIELVAQNTRLIV